MQYQNRKYPLFSACGLNCGLCPRYHTEGTSKCPGCAGEGFSNKHPSCGVLSCCQRRKIEYCFQCDEYPCRKYDGADLSDSFITHKNQLTDFAKVNQSGLDSYIFILNEKIGILEHLIKNYDDGRHKSFFCLAVNLLDPEDILAVMEKLAVSSVRAGDLKARAKAAAALLEEAADKKEISLKLRKK